MFKLNNYKLYNRQLGNNPYCSILYTSKRFHMSTHLLNIGCPWEVRTSPFEGMNGK